ncbi:MAG: hypothetical protein HC919_07000 [Oscillatoriales cyanobacterium SM2_2_1]|nr:hypothetical protein [Oscillatoriales cyanobacterium SM2_2_1]
MSLIERGMKTLQVSMFSEVLLSAYHNDRRTLFWQYSLELLEVPRAIEPAVPAAMVPQAALVPSPPNAAALITSQRLSLGARYPAGYQDVIVRFLEPHTGAVRCLTTLTEFLQALRKPSFSFMAIAADPSLRLLLDVIADSYVTDERGEQLLTNISILQPGKPWQTVRVRLTSDVVFETDAPDLHGGLSELLPAIAQTDAPPPLPVEDLMASTGSTHGDQFPVSSQADSQTRDGLTEPRAPINQLDQLDQPIDQPINPYIEESSEESLSRPLNKLVDNQLDLSLQDMLAELETAEPEFLADLASALEPGQDLPPQPTPNYIDTTEVDLLTDFSELAMVSTPLNTITDELETVDSLDFFASFTASSDDESLSEFSGGDRPLSDSSEVAPESALPAISDLMTDLSETPEPSDSLDFFANFEEGTTPSTRPFPSTPNGELDDLFTELEPQPLPTVDLSDFLESAPPLTLDEFSFELDGANQT